MGQNLYRYIHLQRVQVILNGLKIPQAEETKYLRLLVDSTGESIYPHENNLKFNC